MCPRSCLRPGRPCPCPATLGLEGSQPRPRLFALRKLWLWGLPRTDRSQGAGRARSSRLPWKAEDWDTGEKVHPTHAWHPIHREPQGLWISVPAAAFRPTCYSGSGPSFLVGGPGEAGRAVGRPLLTPAPRAPRSASGELTGSQAAEQQQEQAGAGKEPEKQQLSPASSDSRRRAARFSGVERVTPPHGNVTSTAKRPVAQGPC